MSRRASAIVWVAISIVTIVVAVSLAVYRSAMGHISSLVLGDHFGIATYSPIDRYASQWISVSFRPSHWNRFIVWDSIEFDHPHWKLNQANIGIQAGIYRPDFTYEQLKSGLCPVAGTRLGSGGNSSGTTVFILDVSRKHMPSLDEWPSDNQEPYRVTLHFRFLGRFVTRSVSWENDFARGPDPILMGLAGRPIEASYTRGPSLRPSTSLTPTEIARELMSQCLQVYVDEGIYERQRLAGFSVDSVRLKGQREDGLSATVEFSVKPTDSSGMWLVGGQTADADGWIRHCALSLDVVEEDGVYFLMYSSMKKPD